MRKPKQYPKYVYLKSFTVVSTLLPLIEGLSEKDRKYYCFIVSMISRLTKKNNAIYAGIHSDVWINYVGNEYVKYIRQLQDWQIIELNDSYYHAKDLHFTMSYRLHPTVIQSERVTVEFKHKRVKPLKDKSMITDNTIRFIYTNLQLISVKYELVPMVDSVDEVDCNEWANAIYWDQFNLKYGEKVSRMYHSVILMPAISRQNLVYDDDPEAQLYEYDIKSCHPVLLLSMITDLTEKEAYKKLLDADIYTAIANECGITNSRDKIKKDFMYYINGGIKNYFNDYFTKNFPTLSTQIALCGKEMASISQNMEAGIMVKDLPTKIMSEHKGYFYIPMHDGWMGLERDEIKIAGMVRRLFYCITGYNITITKKNLKTNEETLMD